MQGKGATFSSLKLTLGHGFDFLGLLLIPVVTEAVEEERGNRLDLDLASSLKFKSLVGSANKRGKKNFSSSGTTRGKNWARSPGKRILLLSYKIQSQKNG